jgi:hypothetical protein
MIKTDRFMKLREMINRLEELSHNGRNDEMEVHAVSLDEMIDVDVRGAWLDRFVTENDEYEYVKIEIDA